MAATYTDNGTNEPNGVHLEFSYAFPILKNEDLKVSINGALQASTKYALTTNNNTTTITFNATSIDSTLQEPTTAGGKVAGAPKADTVVRVYRQTEVGSSDGNEVPARTFAAGSSIRASDLQANQEQALYGIKELQDKYKGAGDTNWGIAPEVYADGVMEVGRYIDFHHTDASTTDYEPRLHTDGTDSNSLYISGSTADQKILTTTDINKSTDTWEQSNTKIASGASIDQRIGSLDWDTSTLNTRIDSRITTIESNDFTGASASAAGNVGLVPKPAAGDNTKYLKGDGTWGTVSGGGSGTTNLSNTANGDSLSINSSSGDNTSLPAATISAWGVMTDTDKNNLDTNTAKVTNATHTGDVTGSGALTIANDAVTGAKIADDAVDSEHIAAGAIDLEHMSSESVDEDNLKISNTGTNGQFLSKQSGNDGGLTWATVSSGSGGTVTNVTGTSPISVTNGTTTPAISVDLSGYSTTSHNHNSAYAPTAGSSSVTTLGTIGTGTWQGTAIADSYIASASTWNGKQAALTFGIANTNAVKIDHATVGSGEYAKFTSSGLESKTTSELKTDLSLAKADVGLSNVENTAVSTWAGSTNIASLGTITAGTWQGTAITADYVGDLAASKITSGTFASARIPTLNQNTTGSAAKLTTGANINGVSFDGSAAITVVDSSRMPLTGGTFTGSVTFEDAINENVYECTGTELEPDNGMIQYKTLSGDTTFTESIATGQSMLIMITAGNHNLTWPTITWAGGSAPTLSTSAQTAIELWKVGSALYGANVGDL